jgi:hypothetical protein
MMAGQVRFKDMFDGVDIDEKWFYLTRKKVSYILLAAHDKGNSKGDVYRTGKMVMFLYAQARPRWDLQPC